MNYNNIYTICYNSLDVFISKKEAKQFYNECYYMSEGAEQKRYASILVDLNFSNIGKDNVSTYCSEINIKNNKNSQEFVKITLNNHLSIEDTIKFYEKKIQPILEVSNRYGIDFNDRIPFEYFGDDSESLNLQSFSDYYKEILEKFNLKVESIKTESKSDGKYTITINEEKFDIVAWDNLSKVLDNVDSMLEILSINKKVEEEIEI